MKRLLAIALALAVADAWAEMVSHWDGGRNIPVHRVTLLDEFGDPIVPGAPGALPVSTRQTCGQCHNYETIASGWHSNMSSTNAVVGRPAQPWFLIDPSSGSQIPMSLRGWPGTFKPSHLGMTNWEWTYLFGRHSPGGDIAEPADLFAESGPAARWEVSGPVELNCFACHSQSPAYDHNEWVRLIMRQNFRWAATGALGLGEVRGMGKRMPDFWGVLRGLNPDDPVYAVPPHVIYDRRQFDMRNRVLLELGNPSAQNCLSCHSTTQAEMPRKEIDGDVHFTAGMSCTDCHGSGLDHAIARGYEGDAAGDSTGVMDRGRASASCVGCHVDPALAGRHGAPRPSHTGIPLVHFRKLSCTVCHSGVTEGGELAQVRTSRANRMGVYGRARWVTPQPFILEPVFVRNDQGKIEPRRMAWPAFWGTRDAADPAQVTPLRPDAVQAACADLLDVREQVGRILAALATNPRIPGEPLFAVDGKLFSADGDSRAQPAGAEAGASGWLYRTPTNLVAAIPPFNPDASADQMNDEQFAQHQAALTTLGELLQTLDASPLTWFGRHGAAVVGSHLFYRGGVDDALISTNAPTGLGPVELGWYLDGGFTPLVSGVTARNAAALAGTDASLTEELVSLGLKQLAERGHERAVYVAHGQVWELDAAGALVARVEPAAEPVSWAVGHDVRPGPMARGSVGRAACADCHTPNASFFFAQVASTGPLLTSRVLSRPQYAFMGLSGSYNRLFGTTFLMRPVLKLFLWVVFALVLLVGLAFVAAGVPVLLAAGGIPYGRPGEARAALLDRLAAVGLGASAAYLGFSGLAGWAFHLMTGYALVFHMVAGGLFALCLVALIWFRGGNRLASARRNGWWMVALLLGSVVVFSAVSPMMPWFGEIGQGVMLNAHRWSSMAFLAVSAWMLMTASRNR